MSSTVTQEHPADQPEPGRLHQPALLAAIRAFRDGNFRARLPNDLVGIDGEIAAAFNACIEQNQYINDELARISEVVGREGSITKRARAEGVRGDWRHGIESVNQLIDDLAFPMSEAGRVLGAVANGDLSQQMALEIDGRPVGGEFLRSSRTINTMVDQLNCIRLRSHARRARSRLRRQARRPGRGQGVAGTWKDLPTSVNSMAGNLTARCATSPTSRPPSPTATFRRRSPSTSRGEILELKNTINTMVDQLERVRLRSHARRARSRHRRQARRPGRGARRRRHVERPHRLASTPWPVT